jgi:hypothetical protein
MSILHEINFIFSEPFSIRNRNFIFLCIFKKYNDTAVFSDFTHISE